MHSLQTSINSILSSIPNMNQSSLINDTILYFTSLLWSNKCNTHQSQYPILLSVMVVFILIPVVQYEWRTSDCDW